MIRSLYIKNLAIINEVKIDFKSGLNIITGETGSGKSIIINAIDLLLGSKFKKNLIRSGEEYCVVEGEFIMDGDDYTIRRIFYISGKSKSYLNDLPISLNEIKKKSLHLVDFHGQHQHQKLINIENHIEYLDAFGKNFKELDQIEFIYKKINKLIEKIDKISKIQNDSINKKELYQFQLSELDAINLEKGIDIEIEKNYKEAANAKDIKDVLDNIIYSIEEGNSSILSQLIYNKKNLDRFNSINNQIDLFSNRLDGLVIELKDLYEDIYRYNSSLSLDKQDVEKLSDKFEHIEMIKRKYGGSIDSAIIYKENIKSILTNTIQYDKELEKLKHDLKLSYKEYFILAKSLSKKRYKVSKEINKKILPILNEVGMHNTIIDFEIITNNDKVDLNGVDFCTIKISTNLGEKLKPLNEIVSGGELSRIMLAIKILLQDKDPVDTIIFDEVDSGISGKIAEKIGGLIEELGKKRQIVCITHLSQIASKGDYHLLIGKTLKNKKTNVYIEKLSNNKRVIEIASLISGSKITENAKSQAKQLLLN